jgi:hypothetical protein
MVFPAGANVALFEASTLTALAAKFGECPSERKVEPVHPGRENPYTQEEKNGRPRRIARFPTAMRHYFLPGPLIVPPLTRAVPVWPTKT